MLNANELLQKGIEQVKSVGIIPGKINPNVVINSKAASRFGLCSRKKNGKYDYEIQLNSILLEAGADEKAAMNTMIHEILHTCEGCMNHGPKWKSYAAIMNRKFGYNIDTCNSYEELGLKEPKGKYTLKCTNKKCGKTYEKNRKSKSVTNPNLYKCGECGSSIKLIVNDPVEAANMATKEREIKIVAKPKTKYTIQCTKCKKLYYRNRMSNVIKNIESYKCACNGKLKLI